MIGQLISAQFRFSFSEEEFSILNFDLLFDLLMAVPEVTDVGEHDEEKALYINVEGLGEDLPERVTKIISRAVRGYYGSDLN